MHTDLPFGLWIKKRRKALDLTQSALADRVGCSLATIEKIESEERRPSTQIAELLADALEIPTAERELFLKVARRLKPTDGLASVSPIPFPTPKTTLPIPPTPLIGREDELGGISHLPADATPASQSDAFVCLLDSLQIEKVTVVADSAGGTSALQMALRHPERIHALVLISTAAPTVGKYISLPPKPVIQTVFGSDFLMWVLTTHFQSAMQPAIGIPEGYVFTDTEQAMASDVIRSVLPIERRTAGFVFDMFTSNLDMDQHPDQYPMEKIHVPTMIIHAVNDPLAKYENAEALAARIPKAELLSLPSGGHLLLRMEEIVRQEIARFVKSVE